MDAEPPVDEGWEYTEYTHSNTPLAHQIEDFFMLGVPEGAPDSGTLLRSSYLEPHTAQQRCFHGSPRPLHKTWGDRRVGRSRSVPTWIHETQGTIGREADRVRAFLPCARVT